MNDVHGLSDCLLGGACRKGRVEVDSAWCWGEHYKRSKWLVVPSLCLGDAVHLANYFLSCRVYIPMMPLEPLKIARNL